MVYFSEYIFPILMVVISIAITTLCGVMSVRVKRQAVEATATKTAVRLMIIRDMRIDYRKYVRAKKVTSFEREAWDDMYEAAKALGMNGELTAEWKAIEALPLHVIE